VHWAPAILALALLGFAAVSRRIEGTPITAPMVFTAVGLLFGVDALDLVDPAATGESAKLLAEATLSLVLFADASRIDLRALRGEVPVPARLLGIGLPLTITLGFALAVVLVGKLAWPEALVLAVILAPTDAALGQAVVTLPQLPSPIRQGLNVESGLNDGICVPLFLIALAVAQAEEGAVGHGAAVRLVFEEIGYGVLAGLVAGAAAAAVVVLAGRRGLVDAPWLQVVPVAGAAAAFGLADPIGGSGFIAAFVGGAVFGGLRRGEGGEVSFFIEEAGAVLNATTFVVFGAILLEPALSDLTWQIVLYAALSLTVVRMLPVAIALRGTRARWPTVGFLGWFGPRGLASIVFALIVLEEGGLPHDGVMLTTVYITIGLSVLAHGLAAAPLAERYSHWCASHARDAPPIESRAAPDVRWRGRAASSARGADTIA
jgi:NhaP-type Na+/H+ or K+/H+ antiporter